MRELLHSRSVYTSRVRRAYRIHLTDRESQVPCWIHPLDRLVDTYSCRIWVSTSPCLDDAARKSSIISGTDDDTSTLEHREYSRIVICLSWIDTSGITTPEEDGAIYLCRDHFSGTEKRYASYGVIIGLFWWHPMSIGEVCSNICSIGSKNIIYYSLNTGSIVSFFGYRLTIKRCYTIENNSCLCFIICSTRFYTLQKLCSGIVLTRAKCWKNIDTFYTVRLVFFDEADSFSHSCTVFSSDFFDTDIHMVYIKNWYTDMLAWMWAVLLVRHDPSDI